MVSPGIQTCIPCKAHKSREDAIQSKYQRAARKMPERYPSLLESRVPDTVQVRSEQVIRRMSGNRQVAKFRPGSEVVWCEPVSH